MKNQSLPRTSCLIATILCAAHLADPAFARQAVNTTRDSKVELSAPEEETGFVFVVYGDRTGGSANGVTVLQQAVTETNLFDPDLVMTVGDLIQGYNTTSEWMPQMLQYKAIMSNLECPWYPVAGNHDVYWRGPDRPAEEHETNYEEHFGPLWYDFTHKNAHFIVLYTDEADPKTGVRNFGRPASQKMSDEQIEFLEAALERGADSDHVLVFLHHPRWLKGGYGDDWDKVHAVLKDAGNVSACFAGHIHQMRYDGKRDGIEYVSLATVGGHQNFFAPDAGWDDEFHVITVRTDGLEMAAVPVGETLDVRRITGDISQDARALATLKPYFGDPIVIDGEGGSDQRLNFSLKNPTDRTILVTARPGSDDARWDFEPKSVHQRIGPGGTAVLTTNATRDPLVIDDHFSVPELDLEIRMLDGARTFDIPTSTHPLDVEITLPPSPGPSNGRLVLDGYDDAVVIPHDKVDFEEGPFTLEVRLKARTLTGSRGLVTKAEQSEYGLFATDGVPEFWVMIGDEYLVAGSKSTTLQANEEYHIAGVWDGEEARLYVNGVLAGRAAGEGPRRRNELPLVIGGDVDSKGAATRLFSGEINDVRLSKVARYQGERFTLPVRLLADDETIAVLEFGLCYGRLHPDDSGNQAHGTATGDPVIQSPPDSWMVEDW